MSQDNEHKKQSEREMSPQGVLSGSHFGRYRVLGRIGSGGMGVVYEAYEESLDRRVALKLLPHHMTEDQEWASRFTREARTAAKLEHPGIAAIYAIDRAEDGTLYIAMQYIEGVDLGWWLRKLGKLPFEVALKITREAAMALGEAHEQDIIHRDIKPDNLRIEPSGGIKVMDFGLARDIRTGQRITEAGTFLGTPEYCSPEQCDAGRIDQRSDLYSLGVCLYEMLTGQIPHAAETPYSLFKKIVEEQPVRVRQLDGGISKGVDRILVKMLAKNPQERYATAQELINDLDGQFDHRKVDLAGYYKQVSEPVEEADSHKTVSLRPGGVGIDEATQIAGAAPSLGVSASRQLASRPMQAVGVAGLVLLLLVGGLVGLMFGRSGELNPLQAALSPPEGLTMPTQREPNVVPGRLAIIGFADEQPSKISAEFKWLQSGLPEMLGINLSKLGNSIEVVPFSQVVKAAGQSAGDPAHVARRLGAGLVLVGRYVLTGKKLLIYATLNRYKDGRLRLVGGVQSSGDSARFLQVIDKLSSDLTPLLEKTGQLAYQGPAQIRQRISGMHDLTTNMRAASGEMLNRLQSALAQSAHLRTERTNLRWGAAGQGSRPAGKLLKFSKRQRKALSHAKGKKGELSRRRGEAESDDKRALAKQEESAFEGERRSQEYNLPKAESARELKSVPRTRSSKPSRPKGRPYPAADQPKALGRLGGSSKGLKKASGANEAPERSKDQTLQTNRAWACYYQARQLSSKPKRSVRDLIELVALLKKAKKLAPGQFKACEAQLAAIELQIETLKKKLPARSQHGKAAKK